MIGLSEREYAAYVGVSRGAIQKAKAAGRLVLLADGSIDPSPSDAKRAAMTDQSKPRAGEDELRGVPDAAVSAVGETLRERGLAAPAPGGTTFVQANRERRAEGYASDHGRLNSDGHPA